MSSTEASTVVDAPTTETIGKHVQPAGTGPGPFGIVLICLTVLSTLTGGTWYLVRRHPAQCRQISSVLLCRGLLNKDDYPSTLYSRVDNSETSSLLLNPANVMSDSDDDMLI